MKLNIIIFIFLSILFVNSSQAISSKEKKDEEEGVGSKINSSQAIPSKEKKDEEEGVGSKITRAAFYSGLAKGGEWLVSGVFLNILDKIGANNGKTICWFALRGQFFVDNKEIIKHCGKYVGTTLGISLGITCVDYLIPGGKYIAGCWKRCCESIWEWDSSRSSKRDKVVTILSVGVGVAAFYYREHIFSVLFGKDWRELLWK